MNTCLQNIVSISDPCTQPATPSLSGFDLMDAPEITIGNLANIATETYVSGMALAKKKLDMAILQVGNDVVAALQSSNVVANLDNRIFDSSAFIPGTNKGTYAGERGILLYRSGRIRGKLRKLLITDVEVYPLTDVPSIYLNVYDENGGGAEIASRYNVELVAGQVNTFKLNYEVRGKYARIVFDNTAAAFASAPVTCGEGCDGRLPNDCAYARGWDGRRDVRKGDGYGINVKFQCFCDYNQLLCDLAKTYVGEIIWLKARTLLLEEHLRSNRLNNWIVYNREDTEKYLAKVEGEYVSRWNTLMQGMPNILKNYRDECLDCRGIKWVTNG